MCVLIDSAITCLFKELQKCNRINPMTKTRKSIEVSFFSLKIYLKHSTGSTLIDKNTFHFSLFEGVISLLNA